MLESRWSVDIIRGKEAQRLGTVESGIGLVADR